LSARVPSIVCVGQATAMATGLDLVQKVLNAAG